MTRATRDIVHDLANVLTVVRGSADAVRRQLGNYDPASRDVARIIRATEEAVTLTRELRSALLPEESLPDLPWP